MTAALTPTVVSEAFWAMSNHFKTLIEGPALTPDTPGVTGWQVHMLPAHEIVTFEGTVDGQVSASWVTVDPDTRQEEFNEVLFRPRAFDLIFAKVLRG